MKWLALGLYFALIITNLAASEDSLDDPLESIQNIHNPNTGKLDSTQNIIYQANISSTQPYPHTSSTKQDSSDTIVMEVGRAKDFLEVQKNFPWIRSIGLAMVSFDDGSFKSGFGVLLPDKIFLTSAELAHNASSYPKNIFLKMRDDRAGNLICVAQLRLKAVDKVEGLALFEISGYTDDYCNLRSQSYYHKRLFDNNAYDLAKQKTQATSDFYTVTTTFNNPNISVLKIPKQDNKMSLPIENGESIVFGRPFFSKNGSLLGIATMDNSSIKPIIVSQKEISGFLCNIDKRGFKITDLISDLCHKHN